MVVFRLMSDRGLMWIAERALHSQLPPDWDVVDGDEGGLVFVYR